MVVAMHVGRQLATTTLSKKWLIYVYRRHNLNSILSIAKKL